MTKETPVNITYYRMMAQLAALLINRQGGTVSVSVDELDANGDGMAVEVEDEEMTFTVIPAKGRA